MSIIERGKPAFVLMNIDDYDKLSGRRREISLLELMDSMPCTDGVDYEPPPAAIELSAPEAGVVMSRAEMSKEMPSASSLIGTEEQDFEWLHHAFALRKRREAEAPSEGRTSDGHYGPAILEVGGDKFVAVNFRKFYDASPMQQVCIVKRGINARLVDVLATLMHMPKERVIDMLGLTRATVMRKSRKQVALSSDESSRVMGLSKLIGQVQVMVEESGAPEDFDAAAWVAQWLDQPLPALNGRRPGDLMDTAEGQAIVSQVLRRFRSAAYA